MRAGDSIILFFFSYQFSDRHIENAGNLDNIIQRRRRLSGDNVANSYF
nr:MAG TPA: hypothetical protein [Caudoviricetes sp.]